MNSTLFSKAAYPNWRTQDLKGAKSAEQEEEKALRDTEAGPNKSDYTLVQITTIPDWFCPVICSGLDLSDIIPKSPIANKLNLPEAKKFRFKSLMRNKNRVTNQLRNKVKIAKDILEINNFEENEAVNLDRDTSD